jgi:predicted phosphoribosyltransferase
MTKLRALSIADFLPAFRAFRDRADAGARLAERLEAYRGPDALVLGIPRGGVPVAAEVAARLGGELDVVVARKLGAPGQPELALGAVTADGGRFLNEDTVRELQPSEAYLEAVTAREMAEARHRERRFRGGRPAPRVRGRTVILVDDGLATGATMRAALRAVRARGPARLVVAVPVGSRQACEALRAEADEVVALHQPEPFLAVGLHYQHFEPTEDTEVERLLAAAHPPAAAASTSAGRA